MSVVSSDDAPEPLPSPIPLSSLFLTHWPATCSLFLLPITPSSVLCASCYMSMSLVIKNALWLSHVLVYWLKGNPNIIVINTNNITKQHWQAFLKGTNNNIDGTNKDVFTEVTDALQEKIRLVSLRQWLKSIPMLFIQSCISKYVWVYNISTITLFYTKYLK